MPGTIETGGMIVAVVALAKAIELLAARRNGRRNSAVGHPALTPQQAEELHELHTLHDRLDGDGVPLWYVPRTWHDTQKEMLKELRLIRGGLEKHNDHTTTATSQIESSLKELKDAE